MTPTFVLFGREHLAAVLVIAALTALVTGWGRRQTRAKAALGGRILGLVLVAYYLVDSILRVRFLGVRPAVVAPFDLCSALFFVGAFAFWTRSRAAFDIVYFWTFAGTAHAMITPTPPAGAPALGYFVYFAAHGLLMLSAVYAAAVLRETPVRGSLTRAFVALQAWMLLAAPVNLALGTNFLYLRHKPSTPTLFDHMGPWPWYIVSGEVIALVSFALWALPFRASARATRT